MRKVVALLVVTNLVAPVQAADWQDRTIDTRQGVFVGARIKISLGQSTKPTPHAELAIAPTRSRISGQGFVKTSIGDGVALRLGPTAKPTLALAGVPAQTALGLKPQSEVDPDNRLGISTGALIAIGVAAAAVAGYLMFADAINDHSE